MLQAWLHPATEPSLVSFLLSSLGSVSLSAYFILLGDILTLSVEPHSDKPSHPRKNILLKNYLLLLPVCMMCIYVGCAPQQACGDQRITLWSQFSPSTFV